LGGSASSCVKIRARECALLNITPLNDTKSLLQALEKAQLQIGDLKSEKKKLQEQVDALTAEVTAFCSSKRRTPKAVATIPYADELKNLGKKFAIMEEPWLKPAVFQVPLVINADMDPSARFVDDESYDQGTIMTLHEFIPAKYHDDMVNLSEFAKEVSHTIFSYRVLSGTYHPGCSSADN